MAPASASVFKPRRFENAESTNLTRKSFLADSTADAMSFSGLLHLNTYSGEELTKNDNYCVLRLPAAPQILQPDNMSDQGDLLNGYTDNSTKCALVIGDKHINVWPYNLADATPISFEFPLEDDSDNALQLAILTWPAPGNTLDPGLVTINSVTGHIRFYESVHHAPALGLINNKLIETTVSLQTLQGEYITVAENVEPAGIVVATSWKRVVLVLLRDFNGLPNLSTIELISPSRSLRLLSGWFGRGNSDSISDEVVSIKLGKISGHGLTQEIIVQDAAGTFKKFLFQSSVTGAPSINHRKTTLHKLASFLENNIDCFIPGAVVDVKFLDLWPLRTQASGASSTETNTFDDLYTALIRVQSSAHGENELRLLLVTLRINDSGVLVYASHQLPDVNPRIANLVSLKPRLFIPKPGTTAFVVVGNAVILTDINTTFLSKATTSTFLYYKPRWEDVINLKSNVQLLGLGYEDKVGDSSNASIVLIMKSYGVLRIERFANTDDSPENSDLDIADPVVLLKSHIQQAIFYHTSTAVDFDVGSEYPVDVVLQAVKSIVTEILESSSSYFPPFFSSTRDSLATRIVLLRELISYVKRNFENCWFAVLPEVVLALEKLEAALSLWLLIDVDSPEAALLKEKLTSVIRELDLGTGEDVARSFFTHNVGSILDVLTLLVQQLDDSNYSTNTILKILVLILHDSTVSKEKEFIAKNSELATRMLWIFDLNLVILGEQIFSKAYCGKGSYHISSLQDREDLVKLADSLYYLVTYAIQFMQDTDDDQLKGYLDWYKLRKGEWVNALIANGLVAEALSITEEYQDFYSLAAVLNKEKEQRSPEFVQERIQSFVEKYGYDFASKLFEFYIKHDQIKTLLSEYQKYSEYLEQYFQTNSRSTSQVAWIYYLQAKNFEEASNTLMLLSSKQDADYQQNRELTFSLAKLTALAANSESFSSDASPVLDEIAIESENNLVVIRIQRKLHQSVSSVVEGKKELLSLDLFLKSFANPNIPESQLKIELDSFFQKFVDQLPLLKEQLILLLTSVQAKQQFSNVYADALYVAALIGNDEIFNEQASSVWLKLLTLIDDWAEINSTSGNIDEVNKLKIRETALFTTVRAVQGNNEIMRVLDQVISSASSEKEYPLHTKLRQLVSDNNLALWVDTIKAEARR